MLHGGRPRPSGKLRPVQTPKKLTPEQLAEHLRLLDEARRKDLDELLTDLLCHVYRSRGAQDS